MPCSCFPCTMTQSQSSLQSSLESSFGSRVPNYVIMLRPPVLAQALISSEPLVLYLCVTYLLCLPGCLGTYLHHLYQLTRIRYQIKLQCSNVNNISNTSDYLVIRGQSIPLFSSSVYPSTLISMSSLSPCSSDIPFPTRLWIP